MIKVVLSFLAEEADWPDDRIMNMAMFMFMYPVIKEKRRNYSSRPDSDRALAENSMSTAAPTLTEK